MNPDTRVAICCYADDQFQVVEMAALYRHHGCPITILSPDDSKVFLDFGANRSAGKRAIVGQDSIDRQAAHLKALLEFPEKFFLVHDSDSFCLSPEIPAYLYAEPDLVWSNLIVDSMAFRNGLCDGPSGEPRKQYYPVGFPKLAFQPPYFFSRSVLEKLVAASASVEMNPHLPFIDHYMVQLAVAADVPWRCFPNGFSAPISSHPDMPGLAYQKVMAGVVMVHGAKGSKFSDPLVQAYKFRTGKSKP